jgi:hypothetical protein
MKYIPFPKGTSRKQKAIRLKAEREKQNLPAYVPNTCKHTDTMLIRGNWGPHKAKRVCMECGHFIKWESVKKRLTQNQKMLY